MHRSLDVATSLFASVGRLGAGYQVSFPAQKQPKKLLELYEFEACPFCRRVREMLTQMDLDVLVYPCPKNGTRYRPIAKEKTGRNQFPLLVDPNTEREILESRDIVRYLSETYGDGRVPLDLGNATIVGSSIAASLRFNHGSKAHASRAPEKPLELWSFEASPYCRIARERLCELELPYILHNVGKNSSKRAAYTERSGKMMVPYLHDPNTNQSMFESAGIVQYLNETYGV